MIRGLLPFLAGRPFMAGPVGFEPTTFGFPRGLEGRRYCPAELRARRAGRGWAGKMPSAKVMKWPAGVEGLDFRGGEKELWEEGLALLSDF